MADRTAPHRLSEDRHLVFLRATSGGGRAGSGRVECVAVTAVVVAVLRVGVVDVHQVGASGQGAAWCPALCREKACHRRQLLEEGVDVTVALSGHGCRGLRGGWWA